MSKTDLVHQEIMNLGPVENNKWQGTTKMAAYLLGHRDARHAAAELALAAVAALEAELLQLRTKEVAERERCTQAAREQDERLEAENRRLREFAIAVLRIAPAGLSCAAFHHAKSDLHKGLDCPVEKRWIRALGELTAALEKQDG